MDSIFKMETKDIIMTLAVIIGPILAVQIQKTLEQFREKKQNRLYIQNSNVYSSTKTAS